MFPPAGIHFADVHWALLAFATQREDFDQRLAELEILHASGKLAPGPIVVELCRGIRAFAGGDYEAANLAFEPLMPAITKMVAAMPSASCTRILISLRAFAAGTRTKNGRLSAGGSTIGLHPMSLGYGRLVTCRGKEQT
jgi:hypothetical protein